MLRDTVRDMAGLLVATAALWVYHLYARNLPTAALIGVWAAFALVMAAGLFWRARIRRRAFLHAYVAPLSPLARWLRGGWLLALRQLLLAAVLALLLVVALIRTGTTAWLALLASVPLLALLQVGVRRALAAHVSAGFLPELSWRISLALVGVALFVAVTVIAAHQEYPDFAAVSLERAVWHLVDQENARSDAALTLLQLAAAKDGLRLWLAQQLMPIPGAALGQLAGWLVVVAEQALFVWSYLLVCNGIVIGMNARDRAVA
ncbi:MAG: hypothetical protein ACNA7W_09385 [Pseudomonadales bacterium]